MPAPLSTSVETTHDLITAYIRTTLYCRGLSIADIDRLLLRVDRVIASLIHELDSASPSSSVTSHDMAMFTTLLEDIPFMGLTSPEPIIHPVTPSTLSNTLLPLGAIQIIHQTPYMTRGSQPYYAANTIIFSVNGDRGVRLFDMLNDENAALDGADNTPLQSTGKKITYRIRFTGYPPCDKQCNIRHDTKMQWKSRREIAVQLAQILQHYIESFRSFRVIQLGEDTISFSQLVLLELTQVAKASWQPVLGLLL